MGVIYYLARDDNRTFYEIGKAQSWRDAFEAFKCSDGRIQVSNESTTDLAQHLQSASASWAGGSRAYFEDVARDIVRWSDGHPFVFVGEYDRRYEEDHYRVTGDRYRR